MKLTSKPLRISVQSIFTAIALFSSINGTCANNPPATTAFSETSPDYKRVRLSSGKFKPETYIVGEGVKMDKSNGDESLNTLSFSGVAHILSNALYEADYVPTTSPEETDLLIVINWGRTEPADTGMSSLGIDNIADAMKNMEQLNYLTGSQTDENRNLGNLLQSDYEESLDMAMMQQRMFETIRNEQNAYNAQLLGYGADLLKSQIMGETVMTMQLLRNSLMEELESARYFVVLQAYDFQTAWKEKKRKLLWTTRFSIRAKGHSFDEDLWSMAMASSRVMGRNTEGLHRNLKQARVEFGELEYLGTEKQ